MPEEKFKKYILFDLDGTLTDPKIGICTCVQYALSAFGIEEPDLDKLEPFIGPPLLDSFKEFYGMSDEDAKKAIEKYRERFSTVGLFENEVYKGIPHMLKRLKKNGFHLAVASSKPTVFVEKIMDHFKLSKYFEVMVGSNLDGSRTNKDEVINEALKQLFHGNRINKDLVYMVGDRKFDVEGARKQGVESVAVAFGYGDFEELMEAHADYIVFSPKELEEFLMRETEEYTEGRICRKKGMGMGTISFKVVLTVVGTFLAFIILRFLSEILLTALFNGVVGSVPDGIRSFLLSGAEVSPGSSFYSGNIGNIITGLSYVISSIPLAFIAIRPIRRTAREMYLLHPMNPGAPKIIAGIVFVISFTLSTQIAAILVNAAAVSNSYGEVVTSQYSCHPVIGVIVACLIAPVAEEILFRGIIFTSFRRYTPIFLAVIISGVIFGIYHGNIVQGIYAFIFGCLAALSYEYYGHFAAPVAVHVLQNLVAYLGTYLLLQNTFVVSWVFVAIMGVVALAAVILLFKIRSK